jgi:osmotically inducible lipoprotein OsmB
MLLKWRNKAMKNIKLYLTILFALFLLTGNQAQAQNTKQTEPQKKGWSKKAKGAVIGGATGAAAGRVVAGKHGGTRGAIVGGAAGAAAGGAIGRKKDREKDPKRYDQYADKNKNKQ